MERPLPLPPPDDHHLDANGHRNGLPGHGSKPVTLRLEDGTTQKFNIPKGQKFTVEGQETDALAAERHAGLRDEGCGRTASRGGAAEAGRAVPLHRRHQQQITILAAAAQAPKAEEPENCPILLRQFRCWAFGTAVLVPSRALGPWIVKASLRELVFAVGARLKKKRVRQWTQLKAGTRESNQKGGHPATCSSLCSLPRSCSSPDCSRICRFEKRLQPRSL